MRRSRLVAAVVAAALIPSISTATTFVVDSQLSSLNATGVASDIQGGGPYVGVETSPGGLSASLGGVLQIALTGTTLQLETGSTFTALDEGSFLPGIPDAPGFTGDLATPEPAAYAITYPAVGLLGGNPLLVASRGLAFDISDAAPRTLSAGAVGAGVPDLALVAGEGHLNAGNPAISPIGSLGLVGTSVTSGPGTLVGSGYGATLTLPIEFTIMVASLISTETTYTGTIVATQVPEPATGALVAASACVLLVWRRRR